MQYNTTVFDAIQHNRIWYNTIKLHLFRAALLVPSTQLSYNKFTDHTQSVGRSDGKGEEWSLNLICVKKWNPLHFIWHSFRPD